MNIIIIIHGLTWYFKIWTSDLYLEMQYMSAGSISHVVRDNSVEYSQHLTSRFYHVRIVYDHNDEA